MASLAVWSVLPKSRHGPRVTASRCYTTDDNLAACCNNISARRADQYQRTRPTAVSYLRVNVMTAADGPTGLEWAGSTVGWFLVCDRERHNYAIARPSVCLSHG